MNLSGQGRTSRTGPTGLLKPLGLPLFKSSATLITAGHVPVQWHQCVMGDYKTPGFPHTPYSKACALGALAGLSYPVSGPQLPSVRAQNYWPCPKHCPASICGTLLTDSLRANFEAWNSRVHDGLAIKHQFQTATRSNLIILKFP